MSYSGYGSDDYDYDLDPEERDPGLTALESLYNSYQFKRKSPKIKKRIETLKELQKQYEVLEIQHYQERDALVDKYHKLKEPLYTKRFEIVNGITEVGVKIEDDNEEDKVTKEKGAPNFWFSAMRNNKQLMIAKRDKKALKYLKDINWCRIPSTDGFKLQFSFDPNPYFKNSVLTKMYHMYEVDHPIWRNEFGTHIEWYPGKCLTVHIRKGYKNAKPMTATEICFSFFRLFNSPCFLHYRDDRFRQNMNLIEQNRKAGLIIRDKIIPHAVSWFTGEAVKTGKFDYDETDNEDSNDDEGSEETDDDEEEEKQEKRKISCWSSISKVAAAANDRSEEVLSAGR